MPQVNEFSAFTRQQPFAGQNVPQSVRDKLAAALALQKAASDTTQPVYSTGLGMAKLGAAALGSFMQGRETAQTEAAQQSHRDKLANAILNYGSSAGASPAAPPPTSAPAPGPSAAAGGDHAAYIQQRAAAFGIDPSVALAVARHEGLGAGVGDGGSSYGDFQLHRGGIAPGGNAVAGLGDDFFNQTGKDPADPANWQAADDFALQHAAKNGWGAFHGAAAGKIGPWDGIGKPPVQVASADPSFAPASSAPAPSDTRGALIAALAGQGSAEPPPPPLTAAAAGPSAPDASPNAVDYALSPSGTRDQFAPSVQAGGMPPADGNEAPPPVGFDPSMLGPGSGGNMLPPTGPMPPPGAQSQQPADVPPAPAPAGSPPPDAMSLAGPDPMASAPAQQAINGAMGQGDPASAPSAPSVNPALVQAMMSSGRGVNDPNSPQAFNAQQASPLVQALMARRSGGQMPPAGAPPVAPMTDSTSQGGAPAPMPGPQGGGQPGDFRSQAYDLLRDPYTTPEEASMVMSRLAPQFSYQKADNGDIVRLDPRGILPPQVAFKGGKFAAAHNGVIYNEGDGRGPDGAAGGAGGTNGFRPATDQERTQYGVTDRPMYIGPGGEPHFGMPGAPTQGETEEAKKAGESAATRRNDMITGADTAPEKIARLKLLGTVLDATQSGPLAPEIGNATAIAQRLGVSNERLAALGIDPNGPVNNAVANKLAGEMTMSSIGAKNGGMPASNFSVAERQFIEALYPNIENQPGGNRAVTDVLTAVEQRKLQVADAWAQYKDQQQQAGKPLSYENFEDQFRRAHGQDNIFQPVIDKFKAGGYTPNVPPPASAGGNAPPAMSTPPGAPAAQPAPSQPQGAPPVPGAKLAPDQNWYVPDPNRPGKYLMVKP